MNINDASEDKEALVKEAFDALSLLEGPEKKAVFDYLNLIVEGAYASARTTRP